MQVQPAQSINSNVSFKSSEDLEKASAFVKLNDSQLKRLAFKLSYDKKEQDKKTKKIISTTLWAIPIFDILSKGLLAPKMLIRKSKNFIKVLFKKAPPLSIKADTALKQAGGWGIGFAAIGLYQLIKHAVTDKTKNKNDNKHKNPVSSILADVGITLGGLTLVLIGANKIIKKFPEKFSKISGKYGDILKKLDETKLNTRVLPRIREFTKKFPMATGISKFLLANSIWIMLGVGIYRLFSSAEKQHRKVDKKYHELKKDQAETAKQLVKILNAEKNFLSVEKDILAQNQVEMADELNKMLDCKECVGNGKITIEIRKSIKNIEEADKKEQGKREEEIENVKHNNDKVTPEEDKEITTQEELETVSQAEVPEEIL